MTLEKSGEIIIAHLGHGQIVAFLLCGRLLPCPVKTIKLLEGRLGPDAEPSNMSTRSNLEEIESVDIDEGDTWDVTESAGDTIVLVVDDKWSSALDATTVPHLSLASTAAAGGLGLQMHILKRKGFMGRKF